MTHYKLFTAVSVLLLSACTMPQDKKLAPDASAHVNPGEDAQIAQAVQDRKQGNAQAAVTSMRALLEKDPQNPIALSQLGYALVDTGKPDEAVNIFDQLIAIAPNNAYAYNGKAIAFDRAGNHVAAQELYQHALSLAPATATIQNNLAMSYILNNQPDSAIALLEPLAQQAAASPIMRQNLALAYGMKGERDKALAMGMRDLTPEEALDNMHFYEQYARLREQHQANEDTILKTPAAAPLHDTSATAAENMAAPAAPMAQPPILLTTDSFLPSASEKAPAKEEITAPMVAISFAPQSPAETTEPLTDSFLDKPRLPEQPAIKDELIAPALLAPSAGMPEAASAAPVADAPIAEDSQKFSYPAQTSR